MFNILSKINFEKLNKKNPLISNKHSKPLLLFNLSHDLDVYQIPLNINNSLLENNKTEINDLIFIDDLIILKSNIGEIFYYYLYSKKLKTINFFKSNKENIPTLNINEIRKTLLIINLEKNLDNLTEICLYEITTNKLKNKHFLNLNDFNRIFKNEILLNSSIIEFDDINNVILTKNNFNTYKIWNCKNYEKIFEISDTRIVDFRITDSSLITIRNIKNFSLYLTIYDLFKGEILYHYNLELIDKCNLDIFEIFKTSLILKQDKHNAVFINLINLESVNLPKKIDAKTIFKYINKLNVLFTFNENEINIFDINSGLKIKSIINNYGKNNLNGYDIIFDNKNNYLCVYWNSNKFKEDESNLEILRKDSQRSSSKKSLYSISFSNLDNNNFRNEKIFDCSISMISNNNNNNGFNMNNNNVNLNNMSETFNNLNLNELDRKKKIEIFETNNLLKNNCKHVYNNYILSSDFYLSNMVFSENGKKLYLLNNYGELYEFDKFSYI